MKTGDIIIVPFPFADVPVRKVRPAVVVGLTQDRYHDVIVCAVSSVIETRLSENEFILKPTRANGLRVPSVVKVDRIATLRQSTVITSLGRLSKSELRKFRSIFRAIIK
ncbi:type II toxin-antitoxin system PemK/MazF family toxin [Sphingobacteriales bacterium CHB3]|nr:type II toxin-antitoxin system PemK/MazF family toxin [Sphingobacteriales bacterium CHB3]